MKKWNRRLLQGLSLLALGFVGCAEEREPINRVQPNALEKSFFVGKLSDELDNPVFFSKAFVIDQSVGQNNMSVGLYSGTDRIKWEITEDYLIARKAYQIAIGQDDHGKPEGKPNGTIVARFPITGHFDIKRSYNPQTGEELNVVEENSSDRPWQERQYMRVDWSTNQVVDPMWGEVFFGKIFGDMTIEPLTYTVTNPDHEDAPYFDAKDGYFDVTNKYYTSPDNTYFAPWGISLPTCALVGLFTGSTTMDCNAQEATVRHSFWKVKPGHSFEPTENTKRKMDVIANFGGAGDSFQPGFAGGTTQCWDPQYAYTEACFHQYLVKHNFWANSHTNIPCTSDFDGDKDGTADQCASYAGLNKGSQCDTYNKLCTLPLRDRQIKAIGYWMNKETPLELLDPVDAAGNPTTAVGPDGYPVVRGPMEEVMETWNQSVMVAIAFGREAECRATGGDRVGCHNQFFETEDGQLKDKLQMLKFGGWGVPTPKVVAGDALKGLVSCHAPVRPYDDHTVCGETGEVARNGDQRKNFIYYWPYDSDARYGGVAGLGQDPETGETHGASATVMGRSATRAAANYRDYIQYAMGDFSTDDITGGIPQFIYNKLQQNGYSPESIMGKQARGEKIDFQDSADTKVKPTDTTPKPAGQVMTANVNHKNTMNLLKAQMKSGHDPALQAQAQPLFEALASKLRGTEWEAQIVDPGWAMAAVGANPKEAVTGATLDAASPFRNLDNGRLEIWRAQIGAKLANKGICFLEDVPRIGSVNFAGISRWYLDYFDKAGMAEDIKAGSRDPAMVKARGEYIYHDLFKGMAKGIAIHEVGHCLGMRHNFASSYDAPNYMPQYWQLRTNEGAATKDCSKPQQPGQPDTCMAERFKDPETEDELGLTPGQGRPGVQYFGNTSVMEYEQDYLSPGFGTYDLMYMKAVYGGVLETYDIDRVAEGGMDELDQSRFALNLPLQLSDINVMWPSIVHYTELSREMKVYDPSYCRDATPEELALGEWRIVHGKICGQAPRDHARWDDFYDDEDGGETLPVTWANFTKWHTIDKDNRKRHRWNYRYGETYGHGYLHTNYSDAGADAYEVVTGNAKMFDLTYPLTYFRRTSKSFMYPNLPASIANKYLERARAYHWVLEDSGGNGEAYEVARKETFYFLARAAMTPEPGAMKVKGTNPDGSLLYDVDTNNSISFPAEFQVSLIDGRHVADEFSNENGGAWDYLSWIEYAGFNIERGLAIRALLDGRPTLYTISRDTWIDGRNVMKNFRIDDPEGVDRLIGGIMSEDWQNTAMWVSKDAIPDPNGGLDYRSPQMLNLLDAAPARPAGSAVLYPNLGFRNQLATVAFAHLFGRMDTDMTLVNKMRIYVEGLDFIGAIPQNELIKFVDKNSGYTYVARLYGDEMINGKPVDKGIASRMIKHANDLAADPAKAAELQKYVGLISATRQIGLLMGDGPLHGYQPEEN